MGIKSKFQAGREYTVAFGWPDTKFVKAYSPRSRTLYRETSFAGPMRKRGNEVHQHKNNDLLALDLIAHRKVAPMGVHGLVIRKRAI